MKFSYNWLQAYFTKKLPEPNKLAEILTMHSFEVEEVLKKGKDWIFDIDILPNRAHDCLSYSGLAREVAALINYKQTSPHKGSSTRFARLAETSRGGPQNKKLLDVKIQGKSLVPRYAAYVIEGVSVKQSPNWMKERLASMEQKAISNIVDITNYIMWDTGQPLHAFDFDKIKGGRMTIRESKNGEKLETLDGEIHSLSNSDIIIEDRDLPAGEAGRIIDLAGIKGGGNTQIDKRSKIVVLQAAIFDPVRIRKTTQRLSFRTDAATRYIHGFDPNIPPNVLDYAFSLLKETNPDAKLVQVIDIYPNPVIPKTISLDTNYVSSLLGVRLSNDKIEQILKRLGFKLQVSRRKRGSPQAAGSKVRVTIPTFRLDIENQEDIIEEIGRVFGYENIPAKAPTGTLSRPNRNYKVFWRQKVRNMLSGFGFNEIYSYSLVPFRQPLELQNPISEEFKYLRSNLTYNMLKSISLNQKFFDTVRVFEIGKVFGRRSGGVQEKEVCGMAIYDKNAKSKSDGFYLLKGYIDELLEGLGIAASSRVSYKSFEKEKEETTGGDSYYPGRRAHILLDDKKDLGILGESFFEDLSKLDIRGEVYKAELDFDMIVKEAEEEHEYEKPSKYPEVARDISLLVPRDVMVADVLNAINSVSGPILRDIDLFDIFSAQGGPVSGGGIGAFPEGMKSFAFHLLFQSDKRTLISEEIDDIMKRIVKTLQDNLWEVR